MFSSRGSLRAAFSRCAVAPADNVHSPCARDLPPPPVWLRAQATLTELPEMDAPRALPANNSRYSPTRSRHVFPLPTNQPPPVTDETDKISPALHPRTVSFSP
uniref:Uncharacterized protein n=1 Tax=Sipha flava TaxID=143950 RepID=A0A2S2R845_9HEMI